MTPHEHESEVLEGGHATRFDLGFTEVSFNEWHASVMGLVGLLLGAARRPLAAAALAVYAVVREPTEHTAIGIETIEREPWYFVFALVVSYAAGRWWSG